MLLFWCLLAVMLCSAMSFVLAPLLISQSRSVRTILSISILFPLLVSAMYWQWGHSQQLQAWYSHQAQAKAIAKMRAELGAPEQIVQKLQQRLQAEPQSAQGWYLLARLYVSLQRYAEAVPAFAKAQQLQPENIEIMVQYAQALYYAQHKVLTRKAANLIKQALKVQPDNEAALNLLAVDAYQHGQYQMAIKYWEKILANNPEDSPHRRLLIAAIEKRGGHRIRIREKIPVLFAQ